MEERNSALQNAEKKASGKTPSVGSRLTKKSMELAITLIQRPTDIITISPRAYLALHLHKRN